jgi:SNF2 family DNA or RNA helicase
MIPVRVDVSPDRTQLVLRSEYDPAVVERIKLLPGRVWKRNLGAWTVPFVKENVEAVREALCEVADLAFADSVGDFIKMKEQQASSTLELKSANGPEVELPSDVRFVTTPFDHQKKALALCLQRPSFALFMEMGTGKTKVIIDLLAYLAPQARRAGRPALVVAPVSVIHNWKREAGIHQPDLKVVVLEGTTARKAATLNAWLRLNADVFVINYESAWRMVDELGAVPWSTVILDEATKIKHRSTKQARGIFKIAARAQRRYILTGTPAPNNPLELFNQIRFLDPTVFGTSFYGFRDRYAVMGGFQGHRVVSYKNLDELARKVDGISYRVLKKDCLDLPPKLYVEHRIDMADAQRKAYREMAENLVTEVAGKEVAVNVVLAKMAKLRQLASGFAYVEGKPVRLPQNPKFDQFRDVLEEVTGTGHKVVVWTCFREEIELASAITQELRLGTCVIDGSVPAEKRARLVEDFQTHPGQVVFIGQQRAGGLGITLTAGDYCIFLSNDFSPEIRLQAEDRLHRVGQKNPVTYIDLIMKGTVDASIFRMLKKKQELSQKVTGDEVREFVFGPEV